MSAIQAIGTIMQGNSAASAAESNAQNLEYNAVQVQNDAKIAIEQNNRQASKTIGQAKATYGASGVSSTEGSALDVLSTSASQAAMDSLSIGKQADARSAGYRRSAMYEREQGQAAQTASYFSAAGQLLAGTAKDISGIGGL